MKRTIAFMVVALCAGAELAHAEQRTETEEKLEYVIKISGVEFGNITLTSNKEWSYGELVTNEKWGKVYSANNRMASWFKPDFSPTKSEINYDMRGKKTRFDFEFSDRKVSITRWAAYKKPKKYTRRGDDKIHDVLSMLAADRRGARSFKVITGRRVYDVVFQPLPEEEITTLLGAKKTKPFKITVTRPGKFKQEMKIWFEKNEESTPILLQGSVKFGRFSVELLNKFKK